MSNKKQGFEKTKLKTESPRAQQLCIREQCSTLCATALTEMHLKVIFFFYKTTKSIMHNHNWLSSPFAFIQYVKFSSICRKWEHLFGRNDSSVQWCSKQNLLTGVVEEQEQYYGCLMKIQPVSSWDLYDMNPRSSPVRTNCSSVM